LHRYADTLPDYLARQAVWDREHEAWTARRRHLSAPADVGEGQDEAGMSRPPRRPRTETRRPSEPRPKLANGRPRSPDDDLSDADRRRRERQRAYSAARYAARRAERDATTDNPDT
jgi:hypothetical protein